MNELLNLIIIFVIVIKAIDIFIVSYKERKKYQPTPKQFYKQVNKAVSIYKEPDYDTQKKLTLTGIVIIIMILITSFFTQPNEALGEVRTIRMQGNQQEKNTQSEDNRAFFQQITEDVTVPILNAIIKPIVNPIGNMIIKNAELDREFRPQYKRPAECEKVIDVETMQKCTDHYKNARADFANKKKIVKIKKSMKIVRIPPECFEKSSGKRVSCGNDYIREKAAFNKN